jgi:hypothetical protein
MENLSMSHAIEVAKASVKRSAQRIAAKRVGTRTCLKWNDNLYPGTIERCEVLEPRLTRTASSYVARWSISIRTDADFVFGPFVVERIPHETHREVI